MSTTLFGEHTHVINIGLEGFATDITRAGGDVTHLQWTPPAEGNVDSGRELAALINDPEIAQANELAMSRYLAAQPVLVDVLPAAEAIPVLAANKHILHAGPPIAWADMCGPVQGALIGAVLYEGWADNADDAAAMLACGDIMLEPCHHHNAVGPMAGIISPSMPLWVVENTDSPNRERVFSNFNEGLGQALRFGANNADVIERLKWMGSELADALQAAVRHSGGIELKPIQAQALHMGDEVHNRNAAATGLLLKQLVPALFAANIERDVMARVLAFIMGNDHFFLNLSMASCKSMLNAAANIANSTMVTVMARNGVNFGIQLSGTGKRWYQAPANTIDGLFFPSYSAEDAAADLGDSAITETAGLGGFAMAASQAIVKFVGGTAQDAIRYSRTMQDITIGSNPAFTIPSMNFSPVAAGIDARKVLDNMIMPVINTGIAHKQAGVGQIGAGITTAPASCFIAALHDFTQTRTGAAHD
ncbi:DUF1116 domain-containing protein [Cardiobacteriaceae bacterium TAE3-ERU3]|nr:DUF1116 domain-containing protein [Cardiobacteriaceae bacterium TAE3-ERU3]